MGLLTKRRPEASSSPRALLAAAMPLEGREGKLAWQARSGDDGWQSQAWYYYDAVGELRFAFNWLANAISRATLYGAELDPETGQITGPSDDPRAQAAAAAILGGADERPQLQSTMSLHWQVAGETFILVVPQGSTQPDRWIVLSASSMRQRGGTWSFKDPLTGVWTNVRPGTDKVLRVWSPHPNESTHADSAMRAALPILLEIEKASQNIVARLDSRLAGNGIQWLPQELEFPVGEGEQANAQSFMKLLLEASEASIANPGTAAAHVPIMAQIPGEWLSAMADAHTDLSTAMDGQVTELRQDALNRLGNTLDMAKEIATGQMADANHWSAWQIEEGTYKIHVEPFLLKFGMALTREYYRPALRAMGMDPAQAEQMVLAWDITEVVARPDDKEDVKYLLESNLVSEDWVRSKYGVPDDAIPSEEEARRNLARVLATAAPSILENASIAEALGFEPTAQPDPGPVDDPQAVDEAGGNVRALPVRQNDPPEPDEGLVAAAELVVFDALSRAGGRLLTRQYRGQFASTPKHELHTVIPSEPTRTDALMEGSFQFTDNIAHAFSADPAELRKRLQAYVRNRLDQHQVHDRETLRRYL